MLDGKPYKDEMFKLTFEKELENQPELIPLRLPLPAGENLYQRASVLDKITADPKGARELMPISMDWKSRTRSVSPRSNT